MIYYICFFDMFNDFFLGIMVIFFYNRCNEDMVREFFFQLFYFCKYSFKRVVIDQFNILLFDDFGFGFGGFRCFKFCVVWGYIYYFG